MHYYTYYVYYVHIAFAVVLPLLEYYAAQRWYQSDDRRSLQRIQLVVVFADDCMQQSTFE